MHPDANPREYKAVTRWICPDDGLEVVSRDIHNRWHEMREERQARDDAEAQDKASRTETPMGRFPQTSQLRSDGEWPK
jgi:hypothetical protein